MGVCVCVCLEVPLQRWASCPLPDRQTDNWYSTNDAHKVACSSIRLGHVRAQYTTIKEHVTLLLSEFWVWKWSLAGGSVKWCHTGVVCRWEAGSVACLIECCWCVGEVDHFLSPFEGSTVTAQSISISFYQGLFAYNGWSVRQCSREWYISHSLDTFCIHLLSPGLSCIAWEMDLRLRARALHTLKQLCVCTQRWVRCVVWLSGVMVRTSWVQLPAIPLSGNNFWQVIHTHTRASVTKQCNLIPVTGQCCPIVGKVWGLTGVSGLSTWAHQPK